MASDLEARLKAAERDQDKLRAEIDRLKEELRQLRSSTLALGQRS